MNLFPELASDEYQLGVKLAIETALDLQETAAARASQQLSAKPGSAFLHNLGRFARLWGDAPRGVPLEAGPLASLMVLGTLGGTAGYLGGRTVARGLGMSPSAGGLAGLATGLGIGSLPSLGYAWLNTHAGLPAWSGDIMDTPERRSFGKYGNLIPVRRFADMVWEDPHLQPREQAMAAGLVEGASHLPDRNGSLLVTPYDVARMAIGMGSGALSGLLVGRTLGAVMGLSTPAQNRLRDAGAFAGLLRTVVPLAYGGSQ